MLDPWCHGGTPKRASHLTARSWGCSSLSSRSSRPIYIAGMDQLGLTSDELLSTTRAVRSKAGRPDPDTIIHWDEW